MIGFNPAEFCELPKAEQKEMRVLSVEEIGKFFEVAKESPHYTAYYLDLATGLRRGELLGLRWQDIDFNKGTISVWQQLVKSKTKPRLVFKETKTPKSKRTIKLDPGTTLDVYSSVTSQMKKEATDKIGALMTSCLNG